MSRCATGYPDGSAVTSHDGHEAGKRKPLCAWPSQAVGCRDVKILDAAAVVGLLAEWYGDGDPPERDRRCVGRELSHVPIAWERRKQRSGRPNTNPAAPIFAQDEGLRHVMGSARPNE